jgi:hypothetical protein
MLFVQYYVRFTRFEAKSFLTEALRYFDGATDRVMVDNSSVVVGRGTGADMVPAPEMAAFAERFDFKFIAHEAGDANRSGRVERPFSFIENNFLAGRTFRDLSHLNREAAIWCQKVNAAFKRHLHAAPRDLFAEELRHLKRLPAFIPEVERVEIRTVDVEGFVSVDTNRYSVPADWIHRQVQVRVSATQIAIDKGHQTVRHERSLLPTGQRIQLPEHRFPRGEKARVQRQLDEERQLQSAVAGIAPYLSGLKKRGRKPVRLQVRRLLQMAREYPHEALCPAIDEAQRYGLYDLSRLETMVLSRITHEYFRLRENEDE